MAISATAQKTLGLAAALAAAWLGSKLLAADPPAAAKEQARTVADAPSAAVESTAAAPRQTKYQVAPVADGGTIRASLKLTKAPEGPQVTLNKDQKGCGHEVTPSGRAVYDPATLALANGVVYLVNVAKGKDFEGELAEADRVVTLDQKGCAYVPHVMLVRPGSKVSVKNSDGVQHNAKGFFNSRATLKFNVMSSSNSLLPPTDDTTLDKAGNYVLNCDIHLWMTGYIRALPHPYYAVTRPDGTCTLTNVPPGEYRIGCWHEGMVLKMETTGKDITGYVYSPDFELPVQTVKVPAGGTVDVAFTTDPR